ncbi:MAG: SusC/RagA family TonB-linked outer membrane protein [Bacteroidaceae bacterium]|nr:SusC/RagA family TonB-linked outer membrane protein [Bacteroidaceae bacterium]
MKLFDKKRLLFLGLAGLMLLFVSGVKAQNNTENMVVVTGFVTDAAQGTPMPGVKVQAYNLSRHSAMTKEDGSYSIKIPEYVTSLTFSLDGCNTVVCALKGRTESVNVKMFDENFSEIYKTQTSAVSIAEAGISSVNADLSVDGQMQQTLQGNILSVMRSGQLGIGALMQIDGINSLNINTLPLVVLDGIILDMGYDHVAMHDGFYNNLLANIPVEDIESVQVLKNGYGVYGSKGSNGVILINTKRLKTMATKIDVNISGSYQTMPNLPSVMNEAQYRSYASELLGTTGTTLSTFKFLQSDTNYPYYYWYHENETDWSKISYQDAFVQNYNVSVQGGDEVANYSLSVGYATGDATLVESDFSRFNLRLNSDILLGDRFTMRFDASYSDVTRDLRDDGAPDDIDNTMINAPGFLSLVKSPFLSPYAHMYGGGLTSYLASEDDYLDEVLGTEVSLANPLAILVNGDGVNKNYFGSRFITLAVTPKWEIKRNRLNMYSQFTYTLANSDENYYIPLNGTPRFRIEGIGMVDNKAAAMSAKQDGFMSNTYLDYNRRFNASLVNLQAGFRYINNSMFQTSMQGYNSGNDKKPNMDTSLKYRETDGVEAQDISLTWWGQANYNYKEKYYLAASVGLTASSRFGNGVNAGVTMFGVPWGIFPSVSAAWVASSEPWFKVGFVDYLKFNAGFDITGNDGYDASASKTYFYPVKILGKSGVAMANIGNGELSWETTRKLTAGLDMILLGNRLSVSANMFSSTTDNLLSIGALSYVTGLPETWSNGGSLSNIGFDASFNLKVINSKLFKWEVGAGIGSYKNEITQLPSAGYDTELYGATVRTQVGNPVGVFYGYQTDQNSPVFTTSQAAADAGLYMLSDKGVRTYFEAGDVHFVDQNGDHIINADDMVQIGDPNPDFYGRIYSKIGIGNLSLSATLAYSVGGDVYNYERMLLESGSRFMNQSLAVTNHWMVEGQNTDMPRVVFDDPHQNARFSDRWIEDGSYMRLKNVTLSYKIPLRSTYLQGLTVWGAANNLFTLTNYLGSDPEFASGNNVLLRGIDRGLAPQSTNFSFGLKINL